MFNIGPLELMIILLLALVVVGPSRLPEVGRSIGKGLRELRKVQNEVRDSIDFNLDAEPAPPRPAPKPRTPRRTPVATAPQDDTAVAVTPTEPDPHATGEEPTEGAGSTDTGEAPAGTGEDPAADAPAEVPAAERPAPVEPAPGSANGSTPAAEPPQE